MKLISKTFEELTTKELYEILKSRAEIFIIEQQINYQDMDDIDYKSLHCFFEDKGKIVAYLRAFYKEGEIDVAQVGRVLTLEHGKHLGTELLNQSIKIIKEKMDVKKIFIHAQKHAIRFYEKRGFKIISDEFVEEGIVHQAMELNVNEE